MRKGVLAAGALIGLSAMSTLAAVQPGPHHALWPDQHGWFEAAPGVFTDALPGSRPIAGIEAEARARAQAFWGADLPAPRIMLCTRARCARTLIRGQELPLGRAYGAQLIILTPKGARADILAHELSHAALAHQTRRRAIPAWLDEGIAAHIGQNTRAAQTRTPAVRSAQTRADWAALVRKDGRTAPYAAARAEVAHLIAQHGADALLRLIRNSRSRTELTGRLAALEAT